MNWKPFARKIVFRFVNWLSRTFFSSRLSFSHIEAFVFNNSWKKFFNLFHVAWEKHRGKQILNSKPYLFVYEVTNICNLKCPFCLTGKGISGGRDVRHISFNEAKSIIDEVGDYIYLMQLYTWGEPLLNKDIYKIISYAKEKNIYVMLSTNATAMNSTNNQNFIDSNIDYVIVAIDGGSEETYKKYRVGGDYNNVLKNIKDITEKKQAQNTNKPFIEWQYIVFSHNEHEVDETEKLAYSMGINKFTPLPAYVEDADWLPKGDKYKVEMLNPERLTNCERPWSHINIRADGGVAPCCYEFFKKDDFGNVSDNKFLSVWNNEKFQLSRKLITQKKRGEELDQTNLICRECINTGVRPSFIEKEQTIAVESIKRKVDLEEALVN